MARTDKRLNPHRTRKLNRRNKPGRYQAPGGLGRNVATDRIAGISKVARSAGNFVLGAGVVLATVAGSKSSGSAENSKVSTPARGSVSPKDFKQDRREQLAPLDRPWQDDKPTPTSSSSVAPAIVSQKAEFGRDADGMGNNIAYGERTVGVLSSQSGRASAEPVIGGISADVIHGLRSGAAKIANEKRYYLETLLRVAASHENGANLARLFEVMKPFLAGDKDFVEIKPELKRVLAILDLDVELLQKLEADMAAFDEGREMPEHLTLHDSDLSKALVRRETASRIEAKLVEGLQELLDDCELDLIKTAASGDPAVRLSAVASKLQDVLAVAAGISAENVPILVPVEMDEAEVVLDEANQKVDALLDDAIYSFDAGRGIASNIVNEAVAFGDNVEVNAERHGVTARSEQQFVALTAMLQNAYDLVVSLQNLASDRAEVIETDAVKNAESVLNEALQVEEDARSVVAELYQEADRKLNVAIDEQLDRDKAAESEIYRLTTKVEELTGLLRKLEKARFSMGSVDIARPELGALMDNLLARVDFCDSKLAEYGRYAMPVAAYIDNKIKPIARPSNRFVNAVEFLVECESEIEELRFVSDILRELERRVGKDKLGSKSAESTLRDWFIVEYEAGAFEEDIALRESELTAARDARLNEAYGEASKPERKRIIKLLAQDGVKLSEEARREYILDKLLEEKMPIFGRFSYDPIKVDRAIQALETKKDKYIDLMAGDIAEDDLFIDNSPRVIEGRTKYEAEKRLGKLRRLRAKLKVSMHSDVEYSVARAYKVRSRSRSNPHKSANALKMAIRRAEHLGVISEGQISSGRKEQDLHDLNAALSTEISRLESLIASAAGLAKEHSNIDHLVAADRADQIDDLLGILPNAELGYLVKQMVEMGLLSRARLKEMRSRTIHAKRASRMGGEKLMRGELGALLMAAKVSKGGARQKQRRSPAKRVNRDTTNDGKSPEEMYLDDLVNEIRNFIEEEDKQDCKKILPFTLNADDFELAEDLIDRLLLVEITLRNGDCLLDVQLQGDCLHFDFGLEDVDENEVSTLDEENEERWTDVKGEFDKGNLYENDKGHHSALEGDMLVALVDAAVELMSNSDGVEFLDVRFSPQAVVDAVRAELSEQDLHAELVNDGRYLQIQEMCQEPDNEDDDDDARIRELYPEAFDANHLKNEGLAAISL